MLATRKGFTIVELLIVIVLIGILASIALLAYGNIQQRARDAQRKSDLASIAKSLQHYRTDNGNFITTGSGCGYAGNGGGFYNAQDTNYPTSIDNCLRNAGYHPRQIIDPSKSVGCNGLSCYTYMKYNCGDATYVYAHLESLPQTTTDTDSTCMTTLDTGYGMNYFVKVE